MGWISAIAIYFVLWWLVLFAVLPFGMRTQADAGDITLGTVKSAPSRPHFARAALRTTLITAVIFGIYWGITSGLGYGFNDIPMLVPDFTRPSA